MIKHFLSLPLCFCLITSKAQFINNQSPFADKPADSYSNYTADDGKPAQLLWGQSNPKDFGSRSITFNLTGVRELHQMPAPGIHPRMLFTPDDLPDIRKRLKETKAGQAAWNNILCWTEMMKGRYDDKKEYARPDVWKGEFGGLHGPVPLWRMGVPRKNGMAFNHNTYASDYYDSLANGTSTGFPEYYWNVFSLEAFRALIENDIPAANKLSKAVITALKLDQAKRDQAPKDPKTIKKQLEQPIGAVQLAYIYDILYNFMDDAQRSAIHDELAGHTWSHDNYGTFNTAETARSNWATFSYWLFEVLAIEGEPGYNDLKLKGMYRGWRNLMTYGWYQSGATFEGEAKNQLGMDGIIPLAMRTQAYGFDNLCGHPYLQAYAQKFMPHSIIPTLDGFVKYDLLGGSRSKSGGFTPCDLLGLKYMFPNDKRIDWVYRNAMGEDYSNVPPRPDGYYNGLLFFAIFATDFDPSNNNPTALDLGNTFFCGQRALLMTRSGWDTKDALMLNMHTRAANGGHASADRNAIMLTGAGRVWSPIQGGGAYESYKNSIVVIDNKTQSLDVPGQMLDFKDEPLATFATGSAKYCWDWNWKRLHKKRGYYTIDDVKNNKVEIPAGWQPETNTNNYFAYLKLPYAYLDKPLFENPDWIQPSGALNPVVKQPFYPVVKAYRTAGVVRAYKPYALVVDDIAKDDKPHHYDWILTIEPDIQILKSEKINEKEYNITLTGSDPDQKLGFGKDSLPGFLPQGASIPKGQPMLLVKVLNINNDNKDLVPKIEELHDNNPKVRGGLIRKLIIPSDAVSPDYKVLLYPYRNGDELPKISTNGNHNKVTVKWSNGQKQEINFTQTPDGRTHFKLTQDKEVIEY